jgi:formate hydrogenlyase subunit 3/multisubunit Na+/H+ antiporter MnhD subunit
MEYILAATSLLAYGTRRIDRVSRTFSTMPRTAFCWLFGILMICAMPPSPLFYTEYLLISQAGTGIGITVLLLLFAIFCGMTRTAMSMTMGRLDGTAEAGEYAPQQQHCAIADRLSCIPALTLIAAVTFGMALIFMLVKP